MPPRTLGASEPIVVGGVGGSGTRLVAELLLQSGVFMGTDTNQALDNLWFTLLLKRPHWYTRAARGDAAAVHEALRLLEKAMVGTDRWTFKERFSLLEAAVCMSPTGHDHTGDGKGAWPFRRLAYMLRAPRVGVPQGCVRWGWKEPNSHIYLQYLAERYPALHFVLVLRHGLDMALSSNHAQLKTWGFLHGIVPDDGLPSPAQLLRYWAVANTKTIELGRRLLGDRFLVVRYDELCETPKSAVERLLSPLGLSVTSDLDALIQNPRVVSSIGRYRHMDLSVFRDEDLAVVRQLGFSFQDS